MPNIEKCECCCHIPSIVMCSRVRCKHMCEHCHPTPPQGKCERCEIGLGCEFHSQKNRLTDISEDEANKLVAEGKATILPPTEGEKLKNIGFFEKKEAEWKEKVELMRKTEGLEHLFAELMSTDWGSAKNAMKVSQIVDKFNDYWVNKVKQAKEEVVREMLEEIERIPETYKWLIEKIGKSKGIKID